jgi:hypothetical protein
MVSGGHTREVHSPDDVLVCEMMMLEPYAFSATVTSACASSSSRSTRSWLPWQLLQDPFVVFERPERMGNLSERGGVCEVRGLVEGM